MFRTGVTELGGVIEEGLSGWSAWQTDCDILLGRPLAIRVVFLLSIKAMARLNSARTYPWTIIQPIAYCAILILPLWEPGGLSAFEKPYLFNIPAPLAKATFPILNRINISADTL
ncbi:hypothetical protein WKW50_24360 [Ochrobactrum sp. GPK 3]|uniref:hypothetical protein n=1 Tax=Brucella sp. 22210 TaxID=3453892 RepID=UPI0031384F3D